MLALKHSSTALGLRFLSFACFRAKQNCFCCANVCVWTKTKENFIWKFRCGSERHPGERAKLRYAFVQPMGPNSVPRDAGQADFDGGRATRYKFDRATQVRPQSMLESRRSATGRSFAD